MNSATAITSRLRPWGLGMLIFLSGVLAGAAMGTLYVHRMVEHRFRHPDRAIDDMIRSMESELNISAEQSAEIREIMVDKKKELRAFFEEIHPRVESHFMSLKESIRPVLTAGQAAEWDAEFEKMRKSFLPPPPPEIE